MTSPEFDLGRPILGRAFVNLSVPALVEQAIRRNDGCLTNLGAISCRTGKRSGRSPNDKFIAKDAQTATTVNWGKINIPFDPSAFAALGERIKAYLSTVPEVYTFDGFAGADPTHQISLRVVTESAWHCLFARTMFLRPKPGQLDNFKPQWTILHAPHFLCDPATNGTKSEAFVGIDFTNHIVLIAGTQYAGEVKKSIFTIMNYLMPQRNVFPMHCSANIGQAGDVALFFGLSGTGKTTLSADPDRKLIGDDEHGWSESGVFNIEGGCYAKTIKLSPTGEPQIYNAIKFGCVLENVPVDPVTREPDYDSQRYTENTRAAYPIEYIPGCELSGVGGHPTNVFFLTCDAYGVLPPISRLTPDQAKKMFLCGYTAKVAGTEAGVTEPTATFSTCFGSPFFPLPPKTYANMLADRMTKHSCPVWLVNTGWSGGGPGVGSRMKLSITRALLKAALSGELARGKFAADPIFGLDVPQSCPGVPAEVLNPRNTWSDKAAYDAAAKKLQGMFEETYQQYM
ncbi:MAG: phosphoenolpyruvate carboxykinase (ATP) [Gemmataceae bacterium]